MSTGAFDPESFLGTSMDAPLDTTVIPIPEGEYNAVVEKVTAKQVEVRGEPAVAMDVVWEIDDATLAETTGRDKNTVRQTIWLDVSESGAIATGPGKNVGLGRLRDALGQNVAGQAWNPNSLIGCPARILVSQRPDKDDPKIIYNDVKRVGAL